MVNLQELTARLAGDLRDLGHAQWSSDELVLHLRRALREYSRARPRRLQEIIATVAGVRSYSTASLKGLLQVVDLVYPYDITSPPSVPSRPAWRTVADGTLQLLIPEGPRGDGTDDILVAYLAEHSIEGLDGAAETTLDEQGVELVVLGAGGYAAEQASLGLIGAVTVGDAAASYANWAAKRLACYRTALAELSSFGPEGDTRVQWVGEV